MSRMNVGCLKCAYRQFPRGPLQYFLKTAARTNPPPAGRGGASVPRAPHGTAPLRSPASDLDLSPHVRKVILPSMLDPRGAPSALRRRLRALSPPPFDDRTAFRTRFFFHIIMNADRIDEVDPRGPSVLPCLWCYSVTASHRPDQHLVTIAVAPHAHRELRYERRERAQAPAGPIPFETAPLPRPHLPLDRAR